MHNKGTVKRNKKVDRYQKMRLPDLEKCTMQKGIFYGKNKSDKRYLFLKLCLHEKVNLAPNCRCF